MHSYCNTFNKYSYNIEGSSALRLRQRSYSELEYDEDKYISSSKSNNPFLKREYSLNIPYTLFSVDYIIPVQLNKLRDRIEGAKELLTLEFNWDGQAGEPISIATFQAMATFIINYACNIYHNYNRVIDIPHIYPSMCGSIDIDWEAPHFGLLINIAKDGSIATFYADNAKCSQKTEGSFDPYSFDFKLLPIAYNG